MLTVSDKVKFIQSVFGTGKVSGNNITVYCPECKNLDSTKKKLSIRLDDGVNHCWVCGWGARTLLPLLIKHGSAEQVFEYRKNFLPEITQLAKTQIEIAIEKSKPKLPSDFKLLALNTRSRDPDVKAVIKYVEQRELSTTDLWRWRLGTSNDAQLRRRVILPSFDIDGNLNYFVARAVDKFTYMKYVNCDANKHEVIINEINIDWSQRLTLVEGPFDLMKCSGNVTCLLGSSLAENSSLFTQILIHETPVVLMLDSDMKNRMQQIAKHLSTYNIDVWIADLGSFHDPGQMSARQTKKAIDNAKKWTWSTFLSYKLGAATGCSLKI